MTKYLTNSEKETKGLAKKLAKKLTGVIALFGELGAGKTTFAQGFAAGLGIKEKIISPTFVLIHQHPIPNSNKTLYHIDLYRLNSSDSLKSIGLDEILSNQKNIVLIEWAEKVRSILPKNTVHISFKTIATNQREISTDSIIHPYV